jgi:hypothetical protein
VRDTEHVPVKHRLGLGTVVRLDHIDLEWQALDSVVEELDCGGLVERWVDPHTSMRVQLSIAVNWKYLFRPPRRPWGMDARAQ